MNNIKDLRLEFKAACELRNEILSDSYHAVLDRLHPLHSEANVAFCQLERHIQNLCDQLEKLKRKSD